MRSKSALVAGTVGLGLVMVLGMGGVAVAAPNNPWDEVAALLRGVLSVNVVNSEPIPVVPVTAAVVPDEPVNITLTGNSDDYVVPDGKLLVIQAVSFDVNEDAFINEPDHAPGGTIAVADYSGDEPDFAFFFFPLERMKFKWATHEATTIYAPAGKIVIGAIMPFSPDSWRLTFSGVLRDAP